MQILSANDVLTIQLRESELKVEKHAIDIANKRNLNQEHKLNEVIFS